MKKILILGSTGSIGESALEIIRNKNEEYKLVGLSGFKNIDLLRKQILEFKPSYVYVGTEADFVKLSSEFTNIKFYFGVDGLKKIAAEAEYDIILTAVSGAIGIDATIEAIIREKRIALANKETMVAAGSYINSLLKKYPKAEIIPVDSEHSAIFQSLQGNKSKEVKKIIITASGGTFRGKKEEELKKVTVEEALKHPNWSMGRKITIDSSTLVNKGLEVIEAHELFGIDYDDIEVLVHPQSIIHSMVEYLDSSVIAQLGVASMKVPIQYALSYPNRLENKKLESLDLVKIGSLTFEKVNEDVFKGVSLAYKAGRIGKTMPTVLNAANEVAVDLFLNSKIKFLDIYKLIEEAMDRHKPIEITDISIIKEVDKETREWLIKNFDKIGD